MKAKPPLLYFRDYAGLNADYEKWGQPSPQRRQWYFGMNLGRLSWIGHIRLKIIYLPVRWIPKVGLWRYHGHWDFGIFWQLADLEVHWE